MRKSLITASLGVVIAAATWNVARAQDRKEAKASAKPVAEEIQEAIIALRNTDIGNSKGWAMAARKLTEIGKPAVPRVDRGAGPHDGRSPAPFARIHAAGHRRPEGRAGVDPGDTAYPDAAREAISD